MGVFGTNAATGSFLSALPELELVEAFRDEERTLYIRTEAALPEERDTMFRCSELGKNSEIMTKSVAR